MSKTQIITSPDVMGGLAPVDIDETYEKILRALLQSNDIELKTEIQNPLALARLKALATYLNSVGYVKSKKTIEDFIEFYLKYMVSNKREGRKEIIQAISEGLKKEQSVTDKLMTPP